MRYSNLFDSFSLHTHETRFLGKQFVTQEVFSYFIGGGEFNRQDTVEDNRVKRYGRFKGAICQSRFSCHLSRMGGTLSSLKRVCLHGRAQFLY